MGSRKEGNAEQKAKGLDGNNMLTPEGRKMNAAKRQLEKATTAASQHKGISGSTYLDQYNKLKDTKNKTKNQLSSLASMNEQMGYNPTQGMGIMGSLNYNTIGAGADIANLMNNPLVKMAGMATNPLGFAGSMLGKNLYQNFTDEDKNTGFLNAASKTAQDVTPFDTNRITDFLGNLFRQEKEETAPTESTVPATNLQINDPYSIYGGDFNAINFGIGSPTTTDSTDQINTGGFADTDMFRSGVNLSPTEYNPVATSGTNIGLNNVLGNEIISDTGGALTYGDTMYGQEGYDSIIASGGIPVGVTQDMGSFMDRRQGRNQGGLVPPMSGPMSNGIGTLYKQK